MSERIKVLCVEDEQDIRENIAEILRDEGFEVFEATNGRQGFEAFQSAKPDVVISDIMMPELDGYGLLKMVRESKGGGNALAPFIFLSALGQKDDIIKGTNLSANDYLVKPIDFDLMVAKVKEKAANHTKLQENHNRNISNLRNQVVAALPNDLNYYLDIITNTSANLKQEPYGPLPHRRYVEEFDKIYLNAIKLRSAIKNSFDETTIESRINTNEEVLLIFDFLQELISSLSDKFKTKIELEKPFNIEQMPKVKIDRAVLVEGLRKILAGMFKFDEKAILRISLIFDHMNQLVIIFYLDSQIKTNFAASLDLVQISKILDSQNCRFEVVETRENTAVLVVPSHRMIEG